MVDMGAACVLCGEPCDRETVIPEGYSEEYATELRRLTQKIVSRRVMLCVLLAYSIQTIYIYNANNIRLQYLLYRPDVLTM